MRLDKQHPRGSVRILAAVTLAALLGLAGAASAAGKLDFTIAAGDAPRALNEFGRQSGLQLLFDFTALQGVSTRAVRGQMEAGVALKRMLAGTGLTYRFTNAETVSIMRVKPQEGGGPSAADDAGGSAARAGIAGSLRLADAKDGAGEATVKQEAVADDAAKAPQELTVTGSRIRSGVLGEATVQPVFVYTRKDLDRFGAQTFADLQRYIPQLPQTDWNTQLDTAFAGTPDSGTGNLGFTSFGTGLRALGNTATLVLVDGRRVPKLGQRFQTAANSAAYDLSGITLSAVERIEVLTDGASAIYGADALAGVVNIILRKEYRGTELSASYTNTVDTDAGEKRIQASHGYGNGRLRLNVSATWSETNSLAPRDRWWSATSDKRPWGGTDGRTAMPGLQGGVSSVDGSNLPGLNSPVAGIPVGSTGRDLTIADFAAAPLADNFDPALHRDFGSRENESVRLNGSFTFRDWLEPFWEGGWSQSTTHSLGGLIAVRGNQSALRVELPAGYPGNPFGVPIYLNRALHELLPLTTTSFSIASPNWLLGVRGDLPLGWRYEATGSKRWSEYDATGTTVITGGTGSHIYSLLRASVANPDPSQRIILLNDALSVTPHDAQFYRQFMSPRDFGEAPDVWLYDVKFDGPLWRMPAGQVQMALGAELQKDYAHFPGAQNIQRLGGTFKRDTGAMFGEVMLPLVSPAQQIPLVNKLNLNLSARSDDYSDFGAKTVPRYSLFYYPVQWLALRASYGEGYKAPSLYQLYQLERTTRVFPFSVYDPLRGGEAVGAHSQTVGGNAALRPEESESLNAGIVLEVPPVPGLSFSLDYFDLRHVDRIGGTLQAFIDHFPERLTRDDPTAGDIAAGFAGRINSIDTRFINIAYLRTRGMDFELRYQRLFERIGDVFLRATLTRPSETFVRNTPGGALEDLRSQAPWRGTGYLFVNRGAWELGAIATYSSDYRTSANLGVQPVWLFDLQGAYDFGLAQRRLAGWKSIFSNLRLNAGLVNVFDKEPQTNLGSSLGNIDPRGRRYQLSLQAKF